MDKDGPKYTVLLGQQQRVYRCIFIFKNDFELGETDHAICVDVVGLDNLSDLFEGNVCLP